MIDNEIKKQAREIIQEGIEQKNTIGISEAALDAMPDDARALRDAAMETELLRRDGTLEENEKKYAAAEVMLIMDEHGNLEEKMVVGIFSWEEGEMNYKMNAYGYDRLPPDVQAAFGERSDVVEKWVKPSTEVWELHEAFEVYAHHDNEGYDTWEEYRDAKGLGKQEEATIEKAEDVDEVSAPRETPSVDQSTESLITK